MKTLGSILLIIVLTSISPIYGQIDTTSSLARTSVWRAGVAKLPITPSENMWMAGYAARNNPSQGKLHELWVEALALVDMHGNKSVFVTTDLIGIARSLSQLICQKIQKDFDLERGQIILSSTHTHCGPVVNDNLKLIYPAFNQVQLNQIAAYKKYLVKTIVRCVHQAFDQLIPVTLASGNGIARFAVNRRNNKPQEVLVSSDLNGPSDYSVPVITVTSSNGDLISVLFGYACHCTTLRNNFWNGDYAGFAKIALEEKFKGCTAMFFASCAGDQNPEPRGEIALAEQYGVELAAAVTRVIKGKMDVLKSESQSTYKEIELDFSDPPTSEELTSINTNGPEWQQRWAKHYLEQIENGIKPPGSYPYYPIQSWTLGDQTIVSLGGEVVVDYSIRLKKKWGNDLYIVAYSNDVMAYIPSERVLQEGGYEGCTSMRAYGQPSIWAPGIEEKIIREVERQLTFLGEKIAAQ